MTYIEQRKWGRFEQYALNEECTVKLIYVKPNEETSLQLHHKRDEHWKIISGNATIEIGKNIYGAGQDDEFDVPRETPHRISAGELEVILLEVSRGEFDENDITRLEDKYGRVKKK